MAAAKNSSMRWIVIGLLAAAALIAYILFSNSGVPDGTYKL